MVFEGKEWTDESIETRGFCIGSSVLMLIDFWGKEIIGWNLHWIWVTVEWALKSINFKEKKKRWKNVWKQEEVDLQY